MEHTKNRIDLSGNWNCRLDPDDRGLPDEWFQSALPGLSVRLPGTTSENRLGDPLVMEPAMTKEGVRSLRQHYRYVGAAWYQREIAIPSEWTRKSVTLFLERVMFQSRAWIDGCEIGLRDSLSVPHQFELARYVTPGSTHLLTIRIDNRDVRNIGTYASAYTDETQTIWNGMIGRLELRAEDPIRCSGIQVYPDVSGGKVRVKIAVANDSGAAAEAKFTFRAQSVNAETAFVADPAVFERTVPEGTDIYDFEYRMGEDAPLWDEFSPVLHRLTVSLQAEADGRRYADDKEVGFGMREFKADGTQFAVNGRTSFLRGTLDCCIFPLTGYPPMDFESWKRIFETVKSYGLNHVRYHSWCPPEAAFAAADTTGVYLQVEGPLWMDTWNGFLVGSREDHYDYLPAEGRRIIETYGNHPSFCLYSNGNELKGDFGLLRDMVERLKKEDGRRVYTLTSNWDRPLDPADDFFVSQTVDGVGVRGQYFQSQMAEGTTLDFSEAVARRRVPVVSHEVGQYTVYPSMDEIPKYSGVLRAINLESVLSDLRNKGMADDAAKFTFGSGKLALQLYRDEIESALRTAGLGGFQLLDLHDFPGQSTATVGILDSFWETKGLVRPERFRQFCGSTVLLLRMPKRIYTNDVRFTASMEIAHFGNREIERDRLLWTICDEQERLIGSGEVPVDLVPIGNGIPLGNGISVSLEGLTDPSRVTVTLSLENEKISNAWDFWVYPAACRSSLKDEPEADAASGIVIASELNGEVDRLLEEGRSVLLLPSESWLRSCSPGKFFPVFWSPVHFASEDPCGIVANDRHPVFDRFPTRSYAEYHWKELLEHSASLYLDRLPSDFKPIVQVIPNFFHNRKLGNMLEAAVGNGKLVVCSIDLVNRLEERPEAKQLRRSVLSYMAGERFNPAQRLTWQQVQSLFGPDGELTSAVPGAIPAGSDLALGRRAATDSEELPDFAADHGNDGTGHTCWRAADEQAGHWWMVDLDGEYDLTGTAVTFAEEANYLYAIQVSDDGVHWRVAVNRTGQTDTGRRRVDFFTERARYVKVIYNGVPPGVRAGHYGFQVYGT